jgi:hypothetical protein
VDGLVERQKGGNGVSLGSRVLCGRDHKSGGTGNLARGYCVDEELGTSWIFGLLQE